MRTQVKKHKLGSTKPVSQLFMFSNKLNKNIDIFFSGCVIFEIELKKHDYKNKRDEDKVIDFMIEYCNSNTIKRYDYMTIIHNYKATGFTMASLSGDYDYSIAVHDSAGYKNLNRLHSSYVTLLERKLAFQDYKKHTLDYTRKAINEPIKLPKRSVIAITNQLKKTEQSILKSMSTVLATFHKKFQPSYHK
jgi:hypothetical protein